MYLLLRKHHGIEPALYYIQKFSLTPAIVNVVNLYKLLTIYNNNYLNYKTSSNFKSCFLYFNIPSRLVENYLGYNAC